MLLKNLQKLNFNSHAHVERDLAGSHGEILNFHFNSHAHVERDTLTFRHLVLSGNFNSHAHVERDGGGGFTFMGTYGISTHTLTWSVTR